MLLVEGLTLIIQICFVLLAVASIIHFARRRDAVRRDIALFFTSIALPLGIPVFNLITNTQIEFLTYIGGFVLITQPYLIIRLVQYLRFLPRYINSLALGGMFLSWAIYVIFLIDGSVSEILTLIFVAYFLIINGYAVKAFLEGVRETSGVLQERLRFVMAGVGFFALVLLLSGVSSFLTLPLEIATILILFSAFASAMCFYLGFSTPRWLRKMWQFAELEDFLIHINGRALDNSFTSLNILDDLTRVSHQVMSAVQTVIIVKDELTNQWKTSVHCLPSTEIVLEMDQSKSIQKVWDSRLPILITEDNCADDADCNLLKSMSARTLALVPVFTSQSSIGILLVFMSHSSLFPEDDLELLTSLSQQSAVFMENSKLLEQLRTNSANLEATNKELETFSYSVSHDLRAPLRAMDGFSQALLEDYYELVDDEGKEYLNLIRFESQKMGQLIDDLLDLSQLTRTEFNREQADLSAMAHEIIRPLQNQASERKVEFIVAENLFGCADIHLIRIALRNLLENAWKYSGHEATAIIEFGSEKDNSDETIYFVRDNGVGFDMKYADKLFGAFQRLHAMNEFEGTGIGLATVQRVINRHGGKVWAQATLGEGATFFFTIGQGNCE